MIELHIWTHSTLGKIFSWRHIETFILIFPRKPVWHFMRIVSNEDNLHEMSNHVFWGKYQQFVVCWISQESCKGLDWWVPCSDFEMKRDFRKLSDDGTINRYNVFVKHFPCASTDKNLPCTHIFLLTFTTLWENGAHSKLRCSRLSLFRLRLSRITFLSRSENLVLV